MTEPKRIENQWTEGPGPHLQCASILSPATSPEGFHVCRVRWTDEGPLSLPDNGGFVSVIAGAVRLEREDRSSALQLSQGVHVYLPPGQGTAIGAALSEVVMVAASSSAQARGTEIIVRDEQFLSAVAVPERMMRWILTPQYLSRRIFLHHDDTLLSQAGHPVSWFRTTMFDVEGLPVNQDGESVFKMSYNYRSEFNVCYDVIGQARVRMAQHPYADDHQSWNEWLPLDSNVTYCLNESAGGPEEERRQDAAGHAICLRNKHEVFISGGHVTLFCLFDPAPTGSEQHQPGAYSQYGSLSEVLGTEFYEAQLAQLRPFDAMVDGLSLAKAKGNLSSMESDAAWSRYQDGLAAQAAHEQALHQKMAEVGRQAVVARWMGQGRSS